MRNVTLEGDNIITMKGVPDNYVHCIVTSPPYFGLRDYGIPKTKWPKISFKLNEYVPEITVEEMECCLGLEKSPVEFVAHIVHTFRECKRILRDDGTLFLNFGDSYYGSGKGGQSEKKRSKNWRPVYPRSNGQHGVSYGTSDKEPVGYQENDCPYGSLCDVCRAEFFHKSHTDYLPYPTLFVSPSLPNRANREFLNGHFPTWSSFLRDYLLSISIQDLKRFLNLSLEQLDVFLLSKFDEFSQQHQDDSLRGDSFSSFQLIVQTLKPYALVYGHKFSDFLMLSSGNVDTSKLFEEQDLGSQYKRGYCSKCGVFSPSLHTNIEPQSYNKKSNLKWSKNTTLKQKDLIGIPWMVAFALRADGWYLRQDIIWSKRNCMPESVTDRCTKSHEYVFLLSKKPKYFYDAHAILEEAAYDGRKDTVMKGSVKYQNGFGPTDKNPNTLAVVGHERWKNKIGDTPARNKRSVWTIASEGVKDAHFATFPQALIEDMIKAGSSEHGCCANCGMPYVRETIVTGSYKLKNGHQNKAKQIIMEQRGEQSLKTSMHAKKELPIKSTTSWKVSCKCGAGIVPCIVFDPYGGSGTTGVVSAKLHRDYLLCEINQNYITIQNKRKHKELGLFQ